MGATMNREQGIPLTRTMAELKLALGIYSNTSFDDLVGAVLSQNIPLLKSHRILDRRPHCISIICSSGAPNCTFRAYAIALPSNGGIKVTQLEQHSCETLDSRSRQIEASVLSKLAPVIQSYVPTNCRAGGNTKQLQTMVKWESGMELKRTQATKLVNEKKGGYEQHIGQYRLLSSFVQALQHRDANGCYIRPLFEVVPKS